MLKEFLDVLQIHAQNFSNIFTIFFKNPKVVLMDHNQIE
jgi:hypothetical protein